MLLETALMCMAANIYHEAGNQSMIGQMAVGQVVLNRVEDTRFPDTVCDPPCQTDLPQFQPQFSFSKDRGL